MIKFHLGFWFVAAAFVIDAATRGLVDDAIEALRICGWTKHGAIAVKLGLSPQHFSLQVNGQELPTFILRATGIEGFWPALLKIHGKRHGLEFLDNPELRRLLSGLGAIAKRMAKMEPPVDDRRTA